MSLEERVNKLESADKLIMQEFAYIKTVVDDVRADIKDIKKEIQYEHMAKSFVTIEKYATTELRITNLEKIVYGVVGAILLATVGGIMTVILK